LNKYQMVASKVFTSDFLFLLETMPKNKNWLKNIQKLHNQLGEVLDGKQIGDCLLALTAYLSTVLVDNEIDFEKTLNNIEKIKGDIKTENYIR